MQKISQNFHILSGESMPTLHESTRKNLAQAKSMQEISKNFHILFINLNTSYKTYTHTEENPNKKIQIESKILINILIK